VNRRWLMALGGAQVAIDTRLDLTEANRRLLERGQSCLYSLTESAELAGTAAVTVVFGDVGPARVEGDPQYGGVRVLAPDHELGAEDVIYLSYLALESRMNRRGLITLHGAAVERDGQAVLLLGHAGAGKTSAALLLCREQGFRLIGNDLVVVGGVDGAQAVAGTTHLRLRRSAVERCIPALLDLFGKPTGDPWREKTDVTPEQAGIALGALPAQVGAVVFVRVEEDYPSVVASNGQSLVHRLNLYENALRYARGASTPWLLGAEHRFGPFVPSFDSAAAHAARTTTLERLMACSWYVAGPARLVAAHIAGQILTASPIEGGY
jgi:hypothetical protein